MKRRRGTGVGEGNGGGRGRTKTKTSSQQTDCHHPCRRLRGERIGAYGREDGIQGAISKFPQAGGAFVNGGGWSGRCFDAPYLAGRGGGGRLWLVHPRLISATQTNSTPPKRGAPSPSNFERNTRQQTANSNQRSSNGSGIQEFSGLNACGRRDVQLIACAESSQVPCLAQLSNSTADALDYARPARPISHSASSPSSPIASVLLPVLSTCSRHRIIS